MRWCSPSSAPRAWPNGGDPRDIRKEAPWAPIYNEKHITYHSARIGADRTVFVDPFDTPLNYRYIYAKDAQ